MAVLVLRIDVPLNPSLWDPHEVIEDILASGHRLPTFSEGQNWFLPGDVQEGTFLTCEWETTTTDISEHQQEDIS